MAEMSISKKRTFAVFVRATRGGRTVLIREPYNVVEFDSTDPDRHTFLEGLHDQTLDLITGRGTALNDEEIFDDIRIFDEAPYPWSRIGGVRP